MAEAREGVVEAFRAVDGRLGSRLETLELTLCLREGGPRESFAAALALALREHFDDLRGLLLSVSSPEDRARLHRSRIAAKRLRYLSEPVRPHAKRAADVVKRCKRLQDLLGDLNDTHVQLEELASSLETAAVEHARRLHELTLGGDEAALRREGRHDPRHGLLQLVLRARKRLEGLHGELERAWLSTGLLPLSQPVDALVAELEAASREGREIERKWLLERLPEAEEGDDAVEIDQGWLPGKSIRERVRRVRSSSGERFYRTLKAGSGLERIEIEEETSAEVFAALWPLTEGSRVSKRRHRRADRDLVWEVDEFLDRELVLAEVELPDPEHEVELPDWLSGALVREVTDDPDYANMNLAR
jgi:CYTH domain-containing protein